MINIDGSSGEGGGQILRTALSLSCLFQKPFRIFNIRKGRRKSGLMPQHLTAVRAAQLLSDAEVEGIAHGSTELIFSPRSIKSGNFYFDIGTAGSTSLVLQTLIPSLAFRQSTNIGKSSFPKGEGDNPAVSRSGLKVQETTVTLKGGTHVPFSPSFHYLFWVFVPALRMLGLQIDISIESYGFYPKGGGMIRANIFPAKKVSPFHVEQRGDLQRFRIISGVGNLPQTIAERQKKAMVDKLFSTKIPPLEKGSVRPDLPGGGEGGFEKYPFDIELLNVPTQGHGTFIFLLAESINTTAGFTSLGERGKRAEIVGEEAASEFLSYYDTSAAIDPHLADQIVLYLSLCQDESVFTTSRITQHLLTNLQIIGFFHDYFWSVEGEVERAGTVRIKGSGKPS